MGVEISMKKKILLIDVDSTIPNIALMKISTYYKSINAEVELMKLNVPYYPDKKAKTHYIDTSEYYKVFASTIFKTNYKFVKGEGIIFGGTGYDRTKKLPKGVDILECDYELYGETKNSYDFVTRGCIRNCYFCYVPKKEGKIYIEKNVDDVIRNAVISGHKNIMLLDNNVLGHPDHISILEKLRDCNLGISFNQGLDFRLLTEESQQILQDTKYVGSYIFAFDDLKYKDMLDAKMELLKKFKSWTVMMYLYVHPDMELNSIISRIQYCVENNYLPYIMRDISCWEGEHRDFYIDLAAWGNQPSLIKKMTFEQFLHARHKNDGRIKHSLKLWEDNIDD